jgi:hypothetical protein
VSLGVIFFGNATDSEKVNDNKQQLISLTQSAKKKKSLMGNYLTIVTYFPCQ